MLSPLNFKNNYGRPEDNNACRALGHSGERVDIGKATFSNEGDAAFFKIALDSPAFADAFLSMRLFSCIAGAKEMWCHLAYPYDLKKHIRADDLTDLEYALLFMFKAPTGFRKTFADDGGLTGAPHDVNLDPLVIPPSDRSTRLTGPSDLTLSDRASHRFSRIEIR